MKRRLLTVLKWLLIVGLVVALTGVGAFYYAYTQTTIPDPNADFQTETTKVYYADGKTELGQFATQNRESIAYSEMPDNIKQAVVAAEDQSFWTNQGIDPKGILRAAFSNARGNSTQGASTITQQYVKILYLTQERSLKRKVKEAFLSLKIQREQSKQEILEGYLNTIYFGRGAYGIQAAAKAYFDSPGQGPQPQAGRRAGQRPQRPQRPRPGQRQGRQGRAQGALQLRPRRRWPTPATSPPRRPTQAGRELPKFPKIAGRQPVRRPEGPHAAAWSATSCGRLGYSRARQIDGGGLRVTTTFTPEAMDGGRGGRARGQQPEGFGDKELHVAAATRRARHRRAARLLRRPGLPRLPDQLGRRPAAWSARRSSRSRWPPAIKEGFSLKDTFDGNSPYTFPDGLEVRNEGGGDGNDYGAAVTATYGARGVDQHGVRRHVRVDPRRPGEDPRDGQRARHPAGQARASSTPASRQISRDLEPDAADHAGLGPDQPDQHGQRLRHHRQRRRPRQRARDREGRRPHRRGPLRLQGGDNTRRRSTPTSTPTSPTPCSRSSRTAPARPRWRSAARRPARPAPRPTTRTRSPRPGSWATRPQLVDGRDVRPRRRRRPARRLAAAVLRRGLPGRTWTAIMQQDMEGMDVEEFPPPANVDGEAPDRRPRARADARRRPAADQEADARPRSRARPTSPPTTPTDEPTKDPTGIPTTEPTPTVQPSRPSRRRRPTVEPTPTVSRRRRWSHAARAAADARPARRRRRLRGPGAVGSAHATQQRVDPRLRLVSDQVTPDLCEVAVVPTDAPVGCTRARTRSCGR